MRWERTILLATAVTLPFTFAACQTDGEEGGEAEIDVQTEEPAPVIIEEDDDGFEVDVRVDEDGKVRGGVKVKDRDP